MKLAIVTLDRSLEKYKQADNFYDRAKIAMALMETLLPTALEEMKVAAKRLEELERCHCGETMD